MMILPAYSEKEIALIPSEMKCGRILLIDAVPEMQTLLQRKYPEGEILLLPWKAVAERKLGEKLPLSGSFDCMLLDRLLERVDVPQELLTELMQYLTADGCVIAAFANMRYWRNWQELLAGHWRYDGHGVRQSGIRHSFAQPEIVELIQQAKFADLCFDVCQSAAPHELLQMLETAGAENEQDDLETEYWIMRASRQRNQTLWLQQFFTPEIRQQLVYLLRRIETNIDAETNSQEVWRICAEQEITAEYLLPFIQNTMLHPELVLQRLAKQAENSSEI